MVEKIENGTVSIIVPIYNVEKYLEECIESLRNQTYKNIEILLINDESPDRCPEICEKYARKDNRIKVIHKKNGGAASARNLGLDIAKGEFVCFVDSDDYVEENYVKYLLEKLVESEADISVCSFEKNYMNNVLSRQYKERYKEMTQIEYLNRFLYDWTCGMMTNKIFKRNILGDIRFPEGHKIDDEFFTYKIVLKCTKIVIFNDILYHYRMRKSSVMQSSIKYKECILEDKIEYFIERYDLVTKDYPELEKVFLSNLVDNFIIFWKNSADMPVIRKKLKKVFRCYVKKILVGPITLKEKYAFFNSVVLNRFKKEQKEIIEFIEEYDLYE